MTGICSRFSLGVDSNAEGVESSSPALRVLARYAGMRGRRRHNPFGVAADISFVPRLARWRAQAWAK